MNTQPSIKINPDSKEVIVLDGNLRLNEALKVLGSVPAFDVDMQERCSIKMVDGKLVKCPPKFHRPAFTRRVRSFRKSRY